MFVFLLILCMDMLFVDLGFVGVKLVISDNDIIGSFMGQDFDVQEVMVILDMMVVEMDKLLVDGIFFIVMLVDDVQMLVLVDQVGDWVLIFNVRVCGDVLCGMDCCVNIIYIVFSYVMLVDVLV